jgi:hypothetical protein
VARELGHSSPTGAPSRKRGNGEQGDRRNSILAKVVARIPAAEHNKLARIAEAVDRLEKQRKSAMAAVAAPAAAAPEITGTVKPITFDARNLGASHIE